MFPGGNSGAKQNVFGPETAGFKGQRPVRTFGAVLPVERRQLYGG